MAAALNWDSVRSNSLRELKALVGVPQKMKAIEAWEDKQFQAFAARNDLIGYQEVMMNQIRTFRQQIQQQRQTAAGANVNRNQNSGPNPVTRLKHEYGRYLNQGISVANRWAIAKNGDDAGPFVTNKVRTVRNIFQQNVELTEEKSKQAEQIIHEFIANTTPLAVKEMFETLEHVGGTNSTQAAVDILQACVDADTSAESSGSVRLDFGGMDREESQLSAPVTQDVSMT